MAENQTFSEFWKNELTPLRDQQLEGFKFSDETKSFLREFGLPTSDSSLTSTLMREITFIEFLEELTYPEIEFSEGPFVAIASSLVWPDSFLLIQEETDELFYPADDDESLDELCYVNSSLKVYFEFWQILFQKVLLKVNEGDLSVEEKIVVGKDILEKLTEIESKALEDEHNYWPQLLESMTPDFFLFE